MAMDTGPVKGPASYFPSIEKKYGKPIAEWKQIISSTPRPQARGTGGELKNMHGMGHGHAKRCCRRHPRRELRKIS